MIISWVVDAAHFRQVIQIGVNDLKKATKYAIATAIALAVITAIAWVILQPPTIECMALEENILENTFNEMGEVIPVSEYDIYSKSGGKLLSVKVAEGSSVMKGDLLFSFDDSDLKNEEEAVLAEIVVADSQIKEQISALEAQKRSLESDAASLRVQAEQARMEEKRLSEDLESSKALHELGGISTKDFNSIQGAYELAVKNRELASTQLEYLAIQVSVINTQINDLRRGQSSGENVEEGQQRQLLAQKSLLETKLNLLRENQSDIEVFSAQDGIIRDLSVKQGHVIPPGTKLCSVYQPLQYRVECYILVENSEGVRIGDEVEVTLQLRDEDRVFRGKVASLGHGAVDKVSKVGLSEKRIKVEITVNEDGWENVGPYWPVEIRFVTAQNKNCLIVPKTALFEDGDDNWMVWAVREGKSVAVAVERGIQTPSQVEIRGNIQPGEIIVKNTKVGNISEGNRIRAVI